VSWHFDYSSGLLQSCLGSFKVFFVDLVHVVTYSFRFLSCFKAVILSLALFSSRVNSCWEKVFFKPVAIIVAFCLVTRLISLRV